MFGLGGPAERDLVRSERRDLRDYLAGLRDSDWDKPTLCAGWTTRDVVAHLAGNTAPSMRDALLHAPLTLVAFTRSMNRQSARSIERSRALPIDQLLAWYDRVMRVDQPYDHLTGMPFFGRTYLKAAPSQALADTVIHHQDIRRALGHPRTVPSDRVEAALRRVIASRVVFHGRRRVGGLRLRATDADLVIGEGPEVVGPAEALLMAAAGRGAALADLTGEGLDMLRGRV